MRPVFGDLGGDSHEPLDSLGSHIVDEVPRALRVEGGRRLGSIDPDTAGHGIDACELWAHCLGVEDLDGLRTEVGCSIPRAAECE